MKYHLITYGCQMNVADSEEMERPMIRRGMTATAELASADLVIMNTCTVREHAAHKAISQLGRLKRWKEADPNRILIVAGCAASLWGQNLKKRYPYVDLVSPAIDIEKFPEAVAQVLDKRWNFEQESEEGQIASLPPVARNDSKGFFGNENTAFVTIMRGCNLACSYCIVPQVRGRESYRPMPEILEEVRAKAAQGKREVMLLGQTVNSYYWRNSAIKQLGDSVNDVGLTQSLNRPIAQSRPMDFADLLRAVQAIEAVEVIRFMSPHPWHMKPRVIEAMAECSKVARHVHLPVQSGSDQILKEMKRLCSRADYLDIVRQLRAAMPGIQLTTDIIVGFPGETDADFADTIALLEEVVFDGLFVFKFSPRPGTAAAALADDVPQKIKDNRLKDVLTLNGKILQSKHV